MKKFLRFAAIAAITATSLTSCSEDDDDTPTTPDVVISEVIEGVSSVEMAGVFGETPAFTLADGIKPAAIDAFTDNMVTVDGIESVDYVGAFGGDGKDDAWMWDKAWVSFTPESNDYSAAEGDTVTIDANITADVSWDASKRYLLKGNIYVESGATLTIPAGTVVMGDKTTKGALIISRGAMIMAQGTAENPIVFTSGERAGFRNRGDWGGLVICGKGITNKGTDATIEGISAAEGDNGKYGGDANDDNSGKLTYARIEFAGIALSPDNELNSLTMGAVGSGSEIHHIMVSYAGDDAFEWFGGAVEHKYLVAYNTLDDDFDNDAGYVGTVQFGLVMRDPKFADISGARAIEASSSSSDASPRSTPVFANLTCLGPKVFTTANINANFKNGLRADKSSGVEVYNSIIAGFPTGIENKDAAAFPKVGGLILTGNDSNIKGF